jgi:hypothetical protein
MGGKANVNAFWCGSHWALLKKCMAWTDHHAFGRFTIRGSGRRAVRGGQPFQAFFW